MTTPSNESPTEKHTPLQVRPPRILCNTGAWNPLVDTTDIYAGNRGFNREDLFTPFDAPVGIQFEVESALKSEPLLEAVKAWERPGIAPLYIWQDDGAYHMLYESGGNGAAYARSDDAYQWTRPELGQVEFQGSKTKQPHRQSAARVVGVFRGSTRTAGGTLQSDGRQYGVV